ncbi:alpha/beta hydrolase [Chitinophaga vietnamensis]|uniref:alpha/beta hydrolase n=1 Tax=Chitinophaga vietnamensis TaxID=2593957 RepID=UPI001177BF22|nr:alpha/beta fold hydrolase [Chitinophaga vietnamensis]
MKKFILITLLLANSLWMLAQAADTSTAVLHTPTGDIYGTLTVPSHHQQVPVVLIISGSGPTDRDCNTPPMTHTDAFRMLADSLSAHGIASLRYDKRGIAQSRSAMPKESDIRFDDYVNDAAGLLQLLKADKRFSKVYVAGHSEGSLIGMLAAQKTPVNGYISIAGAGESADLILKKQFAQQPPQVREAVIPLIDSLHQGHMVHAAPSLQMFLRSSVQPYLISWMRYDPQQEIKKLQIPVLIIQGSNDIQISENDAQLLKQAHPAAQLVIIPEMSHILKAAPADRDANFKTYKDPTLPLKPELVTTLVQFIDHD